MSIVLINALLAAWWYYDRRYAQATFHLVIASSLTLLTVLS